MHVCWFDIKNFIHDPIIDLYFYVGIHANPTCRFLLFDSVQNWTTQRLTIMKKLNILKQTVSKKLLTRPVNNGCGEDLYVSHASVKRNFGGHRKDCTTQDGDCLEFGRAFTK